MVKSQWEQGVQATSSQGGQGVSRGFGMVRLYLTLSSQEEQKVCRRFAYVTSFSFSETNNLLFKLVFCRHFEPVQIIYLTFLIARTYTSRVVAVIAQPTCPFH